MFQDAIPSRVRLLILGGGIHGVGVLHDFVSRGWKDVHLVEKSQVGSGTSSRSTKLIHGGLRYLKNFRDFWLVSESLHERQVLMRVAGDLVKPLELLLPSMKGAGMPPFMIKAGLSLYDLLAGEAKISPHRKISNEEALEKIPPLNTDIAKKIYSFWDSQTDDLRLVRRIASSACNRGGTITENCRATSITKSDDGWLVTLENADGKRHHVSALYVVNALGPWANAFLEKSEMAPIYHGVNNEGVHLLIRDLGLKSGLLAQSPADGRVFFILPWLGQTLIGTTESVYTGDPDQLTIKKDAVDYLLNRSKEYLTIQLRESDILATFSGLRWLALDERRDITSTSRGYEMGVHEGQRGLLLTIYGGKLTTYRRLSETIGDRITKHFGEFRPSKTAEPEMWDQLETTKEPSPIERFKDGGVAFNKQAYKSF